MWRSVHKANHAELLQTRKKEKQELAKQKRQQARQAREKGEKPSRPRKRPKSAYNLFWEAESKAYQDKGEKMPSQSEFGAKWKALTPEEKAPFEEQQKLLAEQFDIAQQDALEDTRPRKHRLRAAEKGRMPTFLLEASVGGEASGLSISRARTKLLVR
jgi:hypothetical protein